MVFQTFYWYEHTLDSSFTDSALKNLGGRAADYQQGEEEQVSYSCSSSTAGIPYRVGDRYFKLEQLTSRRMEERIIRATSIEVLRASAKGKELHDHMKAASQLHFAASK